MLRLRSLVHYGRLPFTHQLHHEVIYLLESLLGLVVTIELQLFVPCRLMAIRFLLRCILSLDLNWFFWLDWHRCRWLCKVFNWSERDKLVLDSWCIIFIFSKFRVSTWRCFFRLAIIIMDLVRRDHLLMIVIRWQFEWSLLHDFSGEMLILTTVLPDWFENFIVNLIGCPVLSSVLPDLFIDFFIRDQHWLIASDSLFIHVAQGVLLPSWQQSFFQCFLSLNRIFSYYGHRYRKICMETV